MELTDEEKRKLTEWFDSKGLPGRCACCGGTEWLMAGMMAILGFDAQSKEASAGNMLPVIPLACKNCGCVRFFAAAHMGLANM